MSWQPARPALLDTLRAVVNRLVPAEGHPGGWESGLDTFLPSALGAAARAEAPLVEAGLARLDQEAGARHGGTRFAALAPAEQDDLIAELLADHTEPDAGGADAGRCLRTLIRLCGQGFWGDPGNGGNRDGASWRLIGYRERPADAPWPRPDDTPPADTAWDSTADDYDAVVVGSGAGGGVAACVLAEAGLRVLLVERGDWLIPSELGRDHLRSQRAVGLVGDYDALAGPPADGNPRVVAGAAGDEAVGPADPRWNNNAMTLGGGTRVYGAQAWRMCPEDFRMASVYGVPEGSSLADWPLGYEELAPCYDRAEWEVGVSGDATGNAFAGARSRGYPMPPVRPNGVAAPLRKGARALGLATSPVPLLINSTAYNGRGGCLGCATCVGFGCPGDFKNETRNTVIPRALATGRCQVLTGTRAVRLVSGSDGRVVAVELATRAAGDGGAVARRTVSARAFFLGAGAIETARLLLNSPSAREPHGLGNNHDQVGRHLQGHHYAGAHALFDTPVQDCVGPGPSIACNDFRHHNPGVIGGGMLANDFVPTPLQTYQTLVGLGQIPSWGAAATEGMRRLYPRLAMVTGPVHEVPNPDSRVTVEPGTRDAFGVPVARLSGRPHPADLASARLLSERATEWLRASGARAVFPFGTQEPTHPSGGQHQAGTCRMGDDPLTSVTDPWGTVWGHENVRVVDASLHVTNGGVNPVLTILALAYRVAGRAAQELTGTSP
ncbi:GMC family oxidoreductase [Streptomyces profundus]|uniref:GMC family oxidoreductase n=1 Tax=Streptomyces profundus TaxID=2867410 RepID=UPI001D161D6A|nr:GMC family oxidoreductase [Streptomyces sp. MA3_2.13]UED83324.1 gluconate 2-dehydrogenase subunit 3 family protein [Streptomyces sp. MA3_2.13]